MELRICLQNIIQLDYILVLLIQHEFIFQCKYTFNEMFYCHAPSASIKIFILLICIILFYIHFILKMFLFYYFKTFYSTYSLGTKVGTQKKPHLWYVVFHLPNKATILSPIDLMTIPTHKLYYRAYRNLTYAF